MGSLGREPQGPVENKIDSPREGATDFSARGANLLSPLRGWFFAFRPRPGADAPGKATVAALRLAAR
jgi:hypothetical protein